MDALFDLDGVIIDTEPSYGRFWGMMGEKYGLPYDDFADRIKGTTLTQILTKYFPDKSMQDIVCQELEQFENTMVYPIFPYVEDFLERLRQNGSKCAIVTSSNLMKMDNFWNQNPRLRKYFDAVVTDEDVTLSKPDPQPYLIGAERLGVKPENTWIFEDSFNGLLSARRAGGKVIALTTTKPRDQLEGKADLIIDDFSILTVEDLKQI